MSVDVHLTCIRDAIGEPKSFPMVKFIFFENDYNSYAIYVGQNVIKKV